MTASTNHATTRSERTHRTAQDAAQDTRRGAHGWRRCTEGRRTETHAEPRRASQRGREGAQMPEGGTDAETRPQRLTARHNAPQCPQRLLHGYKAIIARLEGVALKMALNSIVEGVTLRGDPLLLWLGEATKPPESPHTDTPKKFFCESCKKVLTNGKLSCIISAVSNKTQLNATIKTPQPTERRGGEREKTRCCLKSSARGQDAKTPAITARYTARSKASITPPKE